MAETDRRQLLRERLGQLRHDLGKYVAFQQRWLAADAADSELLDALRADLLQTRRGPAGHEDVGTVWRRHRDGLPLDQLSDAVELGQIDRGVGVLVAALPHLRGGELERAQLDELAAEARAVAEAVRALHRRFKEE